MLNSKYPNEKNGRSRRSRGMAGTLNRKMEVEVNIAPVES